MRNVVIAFRYQRVDLTHSGTDTIDSNPRPIERINNFVYIRVAVLQLPLSNAEG